MTRIVLCVALAASLAACATPIPPKDPGERLAFGVTAGAAVGAGIGALVTVPFPIAVLPSAALGAIVGGASGGMQALFSEP